METIETMRMPALGEAGEGCAGCAAPLAADQRYCLNCGRRRAGPRVDYRRYLAPSGDGAAPPPSAPPAPPSPAPQAPPPPEPPKPAERDFAPLAAVGGIAVLGLMLLVGVLIGKGGEQPAAAPPQVIRVGEPGGGEVASTEAGGSGAAGSKETSGRSKGTQGTGAKAVEGGLTGEAARRSEGTVQASKGDLEALNDQSGEDYEDTVRKLPDKIATPGAPPPIDKSKAPGAGGGALTIE